MTDDSRDGRDSQAGADAGEPQVRAAESSDAVGAEPKGKRQAKGRSSKPPAKSKQAAKAKPAAKATKKKRNSGPPRSRKSGASFNQEKTPAPVTIDEDAGPITQPDLPAALHAQNPDDISIPPASGDALDEHDHFFAEGEAASKRAVELEHQLRVAGRATSDSRASFESIPPPPRSISPERQRKLTNYVKAAVGFSAVLCLAALARVGVGHFGGAEPRAAAATIAAVAPPPAQEPAAAPPAPPAPPVATPPAAPAAPPVAAAPEEPTVPAKSAKEEKDDARRSLERGKAKDAVAAAQRSVDLDPTDADAWLLLGAAQQELGKGADAHASFVACTKQAKKGEIGECRAMLSWNGPR